MRTSPSTWFRPMVVAWGAPWVAFVVGVLVFWGTLLPAGAAPKPDPFAIPVTRYQLENGLTVLLHRDPSLPQIAVTLWFNVGSKDEKPGRTGFAHLYEHLMFMGSRNVPRGGFDEIMEAEGGFNNASTSNDTTYYFNTGPAHLLPMFLYLEAERLATLPETMTDDKVGLQREVVRNERRQSYENRPYGVAELAIPEAMYDKNHPYSWPVIGSHADLVAASTEDVRQFFYQYYVPSNATLAIAGDFNPEEARRLISHYFGWMKKTPSPGMVTKDPPQKPQKTAIALLDPQVELPRVYLLWHAPKAATKGFLETELLGAALGMGKGSRLHRRLIHEKRLAQEVVIHVEEQMLGSQLIIEVTGQKGVNKDDLQKAVEAEVALVTKEPLRKEELERARNQILTKIAREMESVLSRTFILQKMNAWYGDPAALPKVLADLRALGAEELLQRARQLGLADPQRRLLISVVPGKTGAKAEEAPATSAAAKKGSPAKVVPVESPIDLSKRPTLGKSRSFVPPKAARFPVGNLDVVLVARKGTPMLQTVLMIPSGSARDPADRSGMARSLAALLTEGAAGRSAVELADTLERLGATLEVEVSEDATYLGLDVLAESHKDAMALFADVVTKPTLGAADWQRVQAERIAEVVRKRTEPAEAAKQVMMASLFPGHPYGRPLLGTEASLRRIQAADLRAFHTEHFRPKGATLVIAGELTVNAAEAARLAAPFATWATSQGPAQPAPQPLPSVPEGGKARLVLVDRPAAPQSQIRLIQPGQNRKSTQVAAAEVLNVILGGSFTSRLNQNLRESRGWAYGAASDFLRLSEGGLFFARAAVRTDVTAESVREVQKELSRMQKEPPTAVELGKGRRTFSQMLMLLCERTLELARFHAEGARYGRPLDELLKLIQGAQKVEAAGLSQITKDILLKQPPTVIVVGDLKQVEAPLRALKLPGTIEYRDPEGNLLKAP